MMCDHSLYIRIRTLARGPTPWIVLILCATAAIHFSGSFWMGYLSDDYMHLENAPSIPIFRPLERHHFSPAITMLFKAAACYEAVAWISAIGYVMVTYLYSLQFS